LKEKYGLEHPEDIFNINFFNEKPELFYDFSKGSDWAKYKPTPTHHFIKLLEDKGVLFKHIT